jgi:hypothetical protein
MYRAESQNGPSWRELISAAAGQVVNLCIGTFAFCIMYLLYVVTLDSFYLCALHPAPPLSRLALSTLALRMTTHETHGIVHAMSRPATALVLRLSVGCVCWQVRGVRWLPWGDRRAARGGATAVSGAAAHPLRPCATAASCQAFPWHLRGEHAGVVHPQRGAAPPHRAVPVRAGGHVRRLAVLEVLPGDAIWRGRQVSGVRLRDALP